MNRPARASLGQRLAGRLLVVGVRALQLLPDRPVYRVAFRAGQATSYLMRERRALVRANLGRVCRALDASGAASPRVAAAAVDGKRLDAMVRDVFGHWLLTYVESAMLTRYDARTLRARVELADPEATERALGRVPAGSPGPIYVGMHLGSVELAALYAAMVGRLPVSGPMEQVSNPVLRAYFERTRGALGMDLLPIRGAAPVMIERIRRGEAVALVADRVIAGAGTRVTLFGAPARLPAGPSVLAVETGGPMYALAVLRRGPGEWTGHLERVSIPANGTRRERTAAGLEAQARTFERFVAKAPEQWWTLLFRIWEEDVVA